MVAPGYRVVIYVIDSLPLQTVQLARRFRASSRAVSSLRSASCRWEALWELPAITEGFYEVCRRILDSFVITNNADPVMDRCRFKLSGQLFSCPFAHTQALSSLAASSWACVNSGSVLLFLDVSLPVTGVVGSSSSRGPAGGTCGAPWAASWVRAGCRGKTAQLLFCPWARPVAHITSRCFPQGSSSLHILKEVLAHELLVRWI